MQLKGTTQVSESTNGGGSPNPEVTAEAFNELKTQLDAVIAERDELKKQTRDTKSKAGDAKKLESENAELLAKVSELQSQFEGFKTKVKGEKTSSAIQTALKDAKAHKPDVVAKLLDMTALKVAEDGTPDGETLTKAIEAMKTSDPYLFATEQAAGGKQMELPGIAKPGKSNSPDGYLAALEEAKKAKDPFKAIQEVMVRFGKAK